MPKEAKEKSDAAKNILRQYGYDDKSFSTSDPLSTYSLLVGIMQRGGAKLGGWGAETSDEDIEKITNQFYSEITSKYQQDKMKIEASTKKMADGLSDILASELGSDVPESVESIITDSLRNALVNENVQVDNVDEFIENYKTKLLDTINAQGADLGKVVDNYKKLQAKADAGTLKAGEYEEYQQGLRTYIELQRQAALATGLSQEQADKYVKTLAGDAFNNINTKLLELRENMQDAKDENGNNLFSDEQLKNFDTYSQKITGLNEQFKNGKLSSKDYFNQLSQVVGSIDPTNLQEIEKTFGNINNYMTTMVSTFQDSVKYINSIWTAFQGGGDSLEFVNNFLPAAEQVKSMADSFLKIEQSISSIDLDTREIDYSKPENERYDIAQSTEEIQQKIKATYDVDVNTEQIERAKKIINEEIDGKSVDVYIEEHGLKDAEDGFDNILRQVDNVTDGTSDLTNSVSELGDALGDLSSLDLNGIDSAFEKVSKAFDDLPENVTTLVNNASQEVQQSAQQMSQWMINVAKSDEAYAQIAKQNIISTMSTVGTEVTDATQVSSEALAAAYMADAQNTANFAADANSIAQQAMSTAVQKLGKVLTAMGNAIANLDVEIPLSLQGIERDVQVGPLKIPVNIPEIKTVFKIGGAGTKGLSDIGKSLADFGTILQDDSVSNTIASQFTPVEANYTPNNIGGKTGNKANDGGSGYTPSGGGGKKGSGGSGKSDAEKAAEEAEKLREKIEDFREDDGTALEDVTEELIKQYETEERKLKIKRKNLDYASELVDSEEETTKWLRIQEKLLNNQRKQIQSIYRQNSKLNQQYDKIKSENGQYDIDSWFDEEGEATLAYKNLLNSFAIEERNYRATVSLNSEEDIEAAEKHIDKIKEQREYVENLFDSAQKLKQAWVANNEEIQDLFVEMNDNLKEMRDTLLDKFINQLEREVDETNQVYQDNIDKLDALITVQERYNNVINDSLDTQADLQKELQSNKDSYQYLDDYMRSIIFNEEDYKILSEELDNIMSQADDLAEEYQAKINSLTEDEMYKVEEITNEYERQVDELEKQYELKKAELEVVKAQTKLENAKNERTVRMFVNGAWQWVADPNEIKSATEELSDAQKEQDRIKREQEQQQNINKMEAEKDEWQLKIELNEQLLERVQQSVEDLTTETKSVEEWLKLIATDGVPMLHDIMSGLDKVGDIGNLLANISVDSGLIKGASKNTTEAIKQGLLNGTLDPEQWAEKIGWIKGDNGKWYAPKDDPYYDPSGFDFGKATPESQTTTDKSGVQVQNTGSQNNNSGGNSTPVSQFPKQGSLRNVSSVLNIRSGAGLNYGVVGRIPPSGKPTILGEQGEWAQVNYNGVTGWSNKQYLTYDRGGIMSGKGYALKDVLKPEAVLSPEQTKAWVKLVDNLTDPVLSRLIKTPKAESTFNNSSSKEQIIRDEYTFQNVTIKADNFEEFIASMQGYIPINNN